MANGTKETNALIGVSTYSRPPSVAYGLDSSIVRAIRKGLGGQMSPMPQTKLRWYLADLEAAMADADAGNLDLAAQLWRSIQRDGVLAGVLSTRTGGIVGLPKRFTGDDDIVRILEGRDGVTSVFENLCPPSELAKLAADGLGLGVGVGELLPIEGRDYPVLVRLEPQWLYYRWSENRWYYRSIAGVLPITPGDGRWVLHIDGGRVAPWQGGLWYALGQSWINKQHARMYKSNWEAKLANPARVAVAPQGASESQKDSWFSKVMAWGVNTVFGMTPGYDVKLLESNGRGSDSFDKTIEQCEREYVIAVAGQLVTVTGGTGFANADVHKSIRADLIKSTADALSHTINTQVIPPYVVNRWGVDALSETAVFEWDTKPPADLKADADAINSFGMAIKAANEALTQYGVRVDAAELASRFGVPINILKPVIDVQPVEELEAAE